LHSRNRRIIGIAWFKRRDYPALRAIMDDAHALPADHDAWLSKAYSVVRLEMALGNSVVRVTIDPGTFLTWCEATRQPVDSRARSRYVQLILDRYGESMQRAHRYGSRAHQS
jgi:hypothetical protein